MSFSKFTPSISATIPPAIARQHCLPLANGLSKKISHSSSIQRRDPDDGCLSRWFIGSLVNAGRCEKHRVQHHLPSLGKSPDYLQIARNRRRFVFSSFIQRRHGHTIAIRELLDESTTDPNSTSLGQLSEDDACWNSFTETDSPIPEASEPSQEELLGLVDQYDIRLWADQYSEGVDLYQKSPGPHPIISDKSEDSEWPPAQQIWRLETEDNHKLRKLKDALQDPSHDPETTFQFYRALPAPRVPYLDSTTRHRLLRNLGLIQRKDKNAMLRYLSVVDDMNHAAIPLSVREWNIAISFAGRYVSTTTEVELEAGLHLFRQMEHVAGVRANAATFNILFDIATKSGKFALAEMIYHEMEQRGHQFNRFHHVSMIHYYGLKGDGDGVRHSYKTLVEAGEIVDTVVLNCVISSLIRARESQAAELVYQRMKLLHAQKRNAPIPPTNYTEQRNLTRIFIRLAELARLHPSKLEAYQERSVVAPNSQTYRILIQDLAVHTGDLSKTIQLLDEMIWHYELPLNGSIFLALFKGFAIHGGIRYSQWTIERLESVWKAYLRAVSSEEQKRAQERVQEDTDQVGSELRRGHSLDSIESACQGERDVYIGRWMIVWAMHAFRRCSGQAKVLQIWDEVRPLWDPNEDDLDFVLDTLHTLHNTSEGEDYMDDI